MQNGQEAEAFGKRLARRYMVQSAPSAVLGSSTSRRMAITRIKSPVGLNAPTAVIPPEKSLIFVYRLLPAFNYRLWAYGRELKTEPILAGGLNIADLESCPSVWPSAAFDCLQFHVPRATLNGFSDDAGLPCLGSPNCTTVRYDPVFKQLTSLILPSLEAPSALPELFMDYFVLLFCAHVVQAETQLRSSPIYRGGLSTAQKKKAMELLDSNLDGALPLSRLARECDLSVSHFARSFKVSFGTPVHRWVIRQRIVRAKALLIDKKHPLIDVAFHAGFSDQTTFTRGFTKEVGMSPGRWRKMNIG